MNDERLIRRILRVNHAGEHGAVSIYSFQLRRAERRFPALVPWLADTLAHEEEHRRLFRQAMPSRRSKPCRALWIWKAGGAMLGSFTALFGESGVMACTAAVERTVHKHLLAQIQFLGRKDTELADLTRRILSEEDEHLAAAEHGLDSKSPGVKLLSWFVASATEVMIFLSTRGDSLQLNASLRAA